ncbi:MAG: CoA pyrophosphatase [Alphaproteobacteria bacterium]|nr:CoA pyrophosphatase [Alphaproteobacteria bacterium]
MTRGEILRRLSEGAFIRPDDRGDHDLNPGMRPEPPFTAAAVLVPLVEREQGVTVLLTKRTDHLPDHPGQISFPGGRIDPDDADPEMAALREAREEVGLSSDRVELIGRLATYRTRTGFEITPVVGLVTPPFDVAPDPHEVAEIFEVPLAFLLDPANAQRHSRIWKGMERYFWVFPYANYYIWGATAGMLVNLAQVLRR